MQNITYKDMTSYILKYMKENNIHAIDNNFLSAHFYNTYQKGHTMSGCKLDDNNMKIAILLVKKYGVETVKKFDDFCIDLEKAGAVKKSSNAIFKINISSNNIAEIKKYYKIGFWNKARDFCDKNLSIVNFILGIAGLLGFILSVINFKN